MKKRLVTSLLVTSLAVTSLVGCGSNSTTTAANSSSNSSSNNSGSGKKVTIGVAAVTYNDVWLNYMRQAQKQYAATNPNIKLVWGNADNDASKQLTNVENFINEKVDAIVVTPVDPQAMQPILNAASKAHIPLITVNRRFPGYDGPKDTSYVGSQSTQAGTLEMTQIAKLLNGKGNIAIMLGQLGQSAEVNRLKGIESVLKSYPDIHVVLKASAKWDRGQGMSLMENWLHSGKHIDAVVSENDEMAIGAIRAINAAGLKGKILIGGTDGTPEGLSYVKNGELNVTVYQSALGQGQDSIKEAYEVATGKQVPKWDKIPYEMVTKDNVDKYEAVWKKLSK